MIIYKQEEETIHVYELTCQIQALEEFRKNELDKFTSAGNSMVYTLKTMPPNDVRKIFNIVHKNNIINNELLSLYEFPNRWSRLEKEDNYQECVKEAYCKGFFKNRNIIKTADERDITRISHYFLELEECTCKDTCCQLNGFLNLPESLYYLQLFEQGKFKLFFKGDNMIIKRILMLYKVDYLGSHNIVELETLFHQGLMNKSIKSIINQTTFGEEVIRRIRTAN